MIKTSSERYSGHESFVCRFGWLTKIHRAIQNDSSILRNDDLAIQTLGIGRNMVKSLQFWAESTGVIKANGDGGHQSGPLGQLLLSTDGWDPHLESLESLWLIHWAISSKANLGAWNLVFGESKLARFERERLISTLNQRGSTGTKTLATSTLEQHTSIFINSYLATVRNGDDTSWCPLQDLGFLKASKTDDGRTIFNTDLSLPIGLSPRVFAIALIDYIGDVSNGGWAVDFKDVLKGSFSPGLVFRLDEYGLRDLIQVCVDELLKDELTFVDTADTQSLVLRPGSLTSQYQIWSGVERHDYA